VGYFLPLLRGLHDVAAPPLVDAYAAQAGDHLPPTLVGKPRRGRAITKVRAFSLDADPLFSSTYPVAPAFLRSRQRT